MWPGSDGVFVRRVGSVEGWLGSVVLLCVVLAVVASQWRFVLPFCCDSHRITPLLFYLENIAISQASLQLIYLDRCNHGHYTNFTATEIGNCVVMIF